VFRRRRGSDGDSGPAPEAGGYLTDEELAAAELDDDELDDDELDDNDELDDDELDDDELDDDELDDDELDDDGTEGDAQEAGSDRPVRHDLSDPETWTRMRDSQVIRAAHERSAGPWDGSGGYPEGERIDFGSLLVPVRDGCDVQVLVSEEEGISIAVVCAESALQLQPFAAPRSSGLWHEVLPEIAEEVAKAGGSSTEQDGPFGPELLATVSPQQPAGEPEVPPQPIRFLGADGPRWFLRGLISGPAAVDASLAEPLEDVFADVVVVRGEHAEPPRKPLDIRLPDEARQVLEGQLAAQEPDLLNPFERGPEITETR
jgi:hypothetical protein